MFVSHFSASYVFKYLKIFAKIIKMFVASVSVNACESVHSQHVVARELLRDYFAALSESERRFQGLK